MTFALPSVKEQKRLNPKSDPYSPWSHIDIVGALAALGLSFIGLVVIYSAKRGRDIENFDSSFRDRQALFIAVGFGLMVFFAIIDYRALYNWVLAGFIGAMTLLGLVLVPSIGSTDINGEVRAWFRFGSFGLQPAEPAKLALVMALAWWIARKNGDLDTPSTGVALLIAFTPIGFIMRQPDLGTATVFVVITFGMLAMGGARAKHLVALGSLAIAAGYVAYPSLDKFQRERLTAFIDSSIEANYNVKQAQIAIGNGGLTGTGFGEGTQTTSGLVPEQHTDFIFTVIGEEFGFVGGIVTIALFALLLLRVYRTARIAGDSFGSLICVGVMCIFGFQMFQAIGMTMGLMPVTGIPLPFVSYGGSSVLTSFAALGLVMSVHMRRHKASIESPRGALA